MHLIKTADITYVNLFLKHISFIHMKKKTQKFHRLAVGFTLQFEPYSN